MSDTIFKFLFLGVLIVVTAFAHANQFHNSTIYDTPHFTASLERTEIPLIALAPPLPVVLGSTAVNSSASSAATETIPTPGHFSDTSLQSNESLPTPRQLKSGTPEIHAHAALIADLETGARSFDFHPSVRWPLASLTKLMTAAFVIKNMDPHASVTLTPVDMPINSNERSLTPGDRYTAGDLLRVMLSVSSNIAAESFANTYGRANFIAGLNNMASDWGLSNTYFDDASGLSVSNQSTIDDLETLISKLYASYPQIFSITNTQNVSIREIDSGKTLSFKNINTFAGQSDFIGGKTGYTDEAQGNLISLFNYRNHPILIIVLGTDDRFGDTVRLWDWFRK